MDSTTSDHQQTTSDAERARNLDTYWIRYGWNESIVAARRARRAGLRITSAEQLRSAARYRLRLAQQTTSGAEH